MGELGTAGYVILTLVGALLIEALAFGLWVWARGREIESLTGKICRLRANVAGLERNLAIRIIQDHETRKSNAEAVADFDDHSYPLLDDTDPGGDD